MTLRRKTIVPLIPPWQNGPFDAGKSVSCRNMRRKLYLETFGCQMNVLDSELVLGQLRAQGYESVEERDDADVILYNTCSVREHAEQFGRIVLPPPYPRDPRDQQPQLT